MSSGWRYRGLSALGTVVLTAMAVAISNVPAVQHLFAQVPYFGRPAPAVLPGPEFTFVTSTTVVVVLAGMWPLFKPRPRRILDVIFLTQKRVVLAMIALAALGYFNYTYRLPRSTLMLSTLCLLVVLPLLMLAIRREPQSSSRNLIVGDNPELITVMQQAVDGEVIGCVTGPSTYESNWDLWGTESTEDDTERHDTEISHLGGFSRLEEVLLTHEVDTVLLAFSRTDREEFFGTLEVCHEHGVTAMVHRDYADHVLTESIAGEELLAVDLEPWDWQDYVVKRAFDIAFAGTALLVLAPVIAVIAVAIKLDSPGPVLYSQRRTATFGETFKIHKFRSMVSDAEAETGPTISTEDAGGTDPRVTRTGRFLRQTHLDEIPQLWSILVGDMSVVGPRPERPELDEDMERGVQEWQQRWFVKPGLTGLAQIRGATGYNPETKLRHDIEYIRRQSLWFDLKIVIRQIWQVLQDCKMALGTHSPESDESDQPADEQQRNEAVVQSDENENIANGGQPQTDNT
jgi:exopolysaccharide biosynthesis polyprenyl glycosylphosphotransferase